MITQEEVQEAYEKYGSKRAAAKALGIPRTTFRRKLDKALVGKKPIDKYVITSWGNLLNDNGNIQCDIKIWIRKKKSEKIRKLFNNILQQLFDKKLNFPKKQM